MAYIVLACMVMAYTVVAYLVMAYMVVAYLVMAYIAMAPHLPFFADASLPSFGSVVDLCPSTIRTPVACGSTDNRNVNQNVPKC